MEDLAEKVAAAQDGDEKAFADLVRATYQSTYSLALRLTGNDQDAKDVAQDTYLRAFRALTRFRGEAAFPTWLYRITCNSASNLLEKRRHHNSHRASVSDQRDVESHLADASPDGDPAGWAIANDLRDRVGAALAGLPSLMRQVFVLRELEGLTHSAIAERLGITETAAKVRLHRARKRLQRELASDLVAEVSEDHDHPYEQAADAAA